MEANALDRLGRIAPQFFDPPEELFSLPDEGVPILSGQWGLPTGGTLAQQHARVLLSLRAQGCYVHADNLGYPKHCPWPVGGGKKGRGQLFWCTDCGHWVVGEARTQHRAKNEHESAVRAEGKRAREEELKTNYCKRQRADDYRASRGQATKGPLQPDEWDHLTPALTPGQGAVVEVAAGGVETARIAAEEAEAEKARVVAEEEAARVAKEEVETARIAAEEVEAEAERV